MLWTGLCSNRAWEVHVCIVVNSISKGTGVYGNWALQTESCKPRQCNKIKYDLIRYNLRQVQRPNVVSVHMPWRFGTRHKLHVSFVDDGKHVEETETTVQIHIARCHG